MDDLDVAGENTPQTTTATGHSRITLVLPSLRALKAANSGKKSKTSTLEQRPKNNPRPVKLKPLKEVLTKLITQIKKKDDYAFFISPVDPAQVPGYADAIKHPMDFGTMSVKVAKGKYRSLEEFTTDFRLVTTNAKTFNPPGSIYYTEADRLEVWGLDHIARASAHVIEYETDWNIDIEQDEDGSMSQPPVNIDDEVSTPVDMDGSMATGSRGPSATPVPPQLGQGGKRGPRGPYRKHAQATTVSDGLDVEGRMPGAKDGVGIFPAGSDWAELMIALKIKGKRYKTKKERLRFEKEGPPYLPDGSLDYAEMEDPFSVLNVFAPEPFSRPQVTPLYPTSSITSPAPTTSMEGTQPELRVYAPTPVTIPPQRTIPALLTCTNVPTLPTTTATATIRPPKKRRHWTIVRNVPARARKDKDGDATADDAQSWQVPRDTGPADYGTFATLLGELAASAAAGPNNPGVATAAADYVYGSEHRLYATIRSTVAHRGVKRKMGPDEEEGNESFWTNQRAEEAWDYLRDVVYGGVDGYAYVRSLAEFVAPSVHLANVCRSEEGKDDEASVGEGGDEKGEGEVKERMDAHDFKRYPGTAAPGPPPLGVPLARYIEDNLVDTVTRGRHGWLRDVLLSRSALSDDKSPILVSPFHARAAVLPGSATKEMAMSNEKWAGEQLDMAALIREPEELAREGVLESDLGGLGQSEGGERTEIERALAWSVLIIEEFSRRMAKGGGAEDGDELGCSEKVGRGDDVSIQADIKVEEEEEEEEDDTDKTQVAMDVDGEVKPEKSNDTSATQSSAMKQQEEDPLMKRLRLNLLALTKRAPLDKIAALPIELVPEHIRGIVPIA